LLLIPNVEHLRSKFNLLQMYHQKADVTADEFVNYSLSKKAVRYRELAAD
jgi:hypothetical protein